MLELLVLSTLIFFAFSLAVFIDRLGVPRVSIYIIVGVLFSPDILGQFFEFPFREMGPTVTNISLGIIAFLIGLEIDWLFLKSNRKVLILATVGEVFFAVTAVFAGVILFGFWSGDALISLKFAMALGAIAATTAPASTIAVIEEYGAKGALVTLLLGIIIIDDALGVLVFEFITSFTGEDSGALAVFHEVVRLLGSLGMGSILGVLAGFFSRSFSQEELRFPVFISLVVIGTAAANLLGFSYILTCMFLGLVTQYVSNQKREDLILPIKHIEEFVFIVFFIYAGLHFSPALFWEHSPLILIYIFSRSIGKYFGAFAGASLGGTKRSTAKWLGFGLLPQAGVAIGLALSLVQKKGFEQESAIIINVVLGSTLIYEIFGPLLTKYSLIRSGYLNEKK